MKNIDFLPNRYRQQAAARNAQWWRLVVLGLFGSGIGLASLCQWSLQRGVNAQLAMANSQYEEAQAQERRLATALEQAQLTGREAELHAYLQHPWPRTQVLSALAAAVPEPVVLKTVRIGREGGGDAVRAPVSSQTTVSTEQAQADLAKLPAAERDLRRLRDENDQRRLVVEVEGATGDLTALHQYVAHLGQSALFERAEIVSLEGGAPDAHRPGNETGSSFKLRVTVKFGYGQTHGPTVTAAPPTTQPAPAKG